jgi:hypothetical protein
MTTREMILREHARRSKGLDLTYLSRGASADDVADVLQRQEGNQGKDRDELKAKWVKSKHFTPMALPPDILQPVRVPRHDDNGSATKGPIIVEDNFRRVEQKEEVPGKSSTRPNGFIPETVIIDGQHRHSEALERGQPVIQCIVGDEAMPKILRELVRRSSGRRNNLSARFQEASRHA